MQKETHDRLKNEMEELKNKIDKLTNFLMPGIHNELTYTNQVLLDKQLKVMEEYYSILRMRIEINEVT